MLLSDENVRKVLRESVVPCWETVGQTAKVTIELGNGRIIRRTLGGNTVIWLLRSDGTVVDAFPGVYTPRDFLGQLRPALAAWRAAETSGGGSLASWHRSLSRPVAVKDFDVSISKAAVESPVIKNLKQGRPKREDGGERASNPLRSKRSNGRARLVDVSKRPATSEEVRNRFASASPGRTLSPTEIGRLVVERDSANNVRVVRPLVHGFLAAFATPPPVLECRRTVFEKILQVSLTDPHLGLGGVLVPGTPR